MTTICIVFLCHQRGTVYMSESCMFTSYILKCSWVYRNLGDSSVSQRQSVNKPRNVALQIWHVGRVQTNQNIFILTIPKISPIFKKKNAVVRTNRKYKVSQYNLHTPLWEPVFIFALCSSLWSSECPAMGSLKYCKDLCLCSYPGSPICLNRTSNSSNHVGNAKEIGKEHLP